MYTYTYDNQGRQLSHTQKKPDNSEAITITARYDKNGNKRFETDGNGNTTENTYDELNRPVSTTLAGHSTTYSYDANGNQTTITDWRGNTSTNIYDPLNRLIEKKDPVPDPVPDIGTTNFNYDIITGIPEGYTAENTTDPKNNITTKVYDKAGRLAEVRTDGQATAYEYYTNGSRKTVIYPNGAREEYTYYSDNLLWTLTNKKPDSSVLNTYTYEYDAAHNQTRKTDSKGITSYTYDSLNRLETVIEPNGKVTDYTFDKAGNRATETITQGISTVVTTYTYNEQNRLISTVTQNGTTTETVKYTYDNNGNMLSKAKTTTKPSTGQVGTITPSKAGSTASDVSFYKYDELNQLVKTIEGDKTILCVYNGEGYRVEKAINGQTTRYLYESDKVILEIDGQGNQTAKNVYGTNLLVRAMGSDKAYYMYNGHADVTALINASTGAVIATYYYDAFGNITEQTGSVNNNFTYAGYQWDIESGLYYLNARYYDSKIARFLTEDTYTGTPNDPISLNLYTYCHNEPVMYTDPDGHWPKSGDILNTLKDSSLGIGMSLIDTGLNTAKIVLTSMAYVSGGKAAADDAWADFTDSIEWLDNNVETYLITDKNTYENAKLLADVAQITYGTYNLYLGVKALSGLKSVSKAEVKAVGASSGKATYKIKAEEPVVNTKKVATKDLSSRKSITKIESKPVKIKVSEEKYPETAKHIEEAQKAGHPDTLTIDRKGTAANRKKSLAGKDKVTGKDRDEYPPAMFKEGGKGASVKPVSPKDNRGAGAFIGNQLRKQPDGNKVKIVVKKKKK